MPTFNKLSPEEVAVLTTRKVNVDNLGPYTEFLQNMTEGEFGSLQPDETEGETRRIVKRRLTMAAKALNMSIRYRTTTADDNEVRFSLRPYIARGKPQTQRQKDAKAARAEAATVAA